MKSYNCLREFGKNIQIEPLFVCSINSNGVILEQYGKINGMTKNTSDIYISGNKLNIAEEPTSNFSKRTYNRLFEEINKIINSTENIEEKIYLNIGEKNICWYEIDIRKDLKNKNRALLVWFESLYLNNFRENSLYELGVCKSLFNSYNICICVENRIKFINNKAVEFLGGSCWSQFLGKRLDDFISCNSNFSIEYIADKVKRNIETISFSEVIKRLDLSEINVDIEITPIYFDGEIGVQVVFTEKQSDRKLKELEDLIYLKSIELDNSIMKEQKKTEFFIDISHDLRTPSNVILGAIQLLNLQMDKNNISDRSGKMDQYLSIIKINALRLLRLINNIIDVTKFDSGFSELHLKKCNIVSFIEEIINSVVPYTENKDIKITFDTSKEEIYLLIDPGKMERVILNIISNAIKFTPKGGEIFITIEYNENINISIRDTGIGMGNEKLGMIFERFSQVNNGFIKEYEGSGIGLSLAKSIVDQHGGSISVESELGKGSNFIISFPNEKIDVSTGENGLFEHRPGSLDIELADICYQK